MTELPRTVALAFGMLLAAPAGAEPAGCFMRTYSNAHLASHPDQVVASMFLHFERNETFDELLAGLAVVTAQGGHVAGTALAGQFFDQGFFCYADQDPIVCSADSDGGSFDLTRNDGDIIEITTRYLMVGDHECRIMEEEGCGEAVDIAEHPGQPVTYRLFRADPVACAPN